MSTGEEQHRTNSGSAADTSSSEPLRLGVCKWFNVLKGWGFVTPDDGGQEVFVHQSVLKMPGFRSLDEGEQVEFRCKQTERGLEATYVAGPNSIDCKGSSVRPLGKKKYRRIRCFNCGQFGNHIASKCRMGQMPKSCYHCKATDHLVADCPTKQQASNSQSGEASASRSEEPARAASKSDKTSETTEEKEETSKNHVASSDSKSAHKA